jgi:hypothetical protein
MMHFSPLPTRKLLALLLAVLVVCLSAGQVTAAPAPVPIAHWPLDGNAQDPVGGYDGVLVGSAIFVSGGVAGSLAVQLDRGLVNMGPVIELAGISHTISLWVKTTVTDEVSWPLAKHHSGSESGYIVGINQNWILGAPNKAWFYNGSIEGVCPTSSLTVNDGAWHHVVGVREYGGNVSLYVDGQFQEAKPDQYVPAPPPGTPLLFGGYETSYGVPFATYNGWLDDVQIYQGALTAQQILFLYQNPGQLIPMPWKTVPAINSLLLD